MESARKLIRDIPDFPKPGILFKDITPVLGDPKVFREVVDGFAARLQALQVTKALGIESRGFIFAAAAAAQIGIGFVPVRKPGKLPYDTRRVTYSLEYGTDSLEMHTDAVGPGERVAIVDDLLATGGTAAATSQLVRQCGAEVAGLVFLVELQFLHGRKQLGDAAVHSFIQFP